MKFIKVKEQSSEAEIYINISHIICFSKLDNETISLAVKDFDKPLFVKYDIDDFIHAIIFLNKNKDAVV